MRRFVTLTPLSISLIYILLGFVWILATDIILVEFIRQLGAYQVWQSLKGSFFVLGTGFILYLMISRYSKRIRKNETHLENAERVAGLGHWFFEAESERIEWSEQTYELFGISDRSTPVTRQAVLDRIHPDDREMIQRATRKALQEGKPYDLNIRSFTDQSDSVYRYLNAQCEVVKNEQGRVIELYGIVQDITDRIVREKELENSLEEKDILLQEIHHRVKNNLAVISGLLQLQIFNSGNTELHDTLEDSLMRIQSIALVHECLYKSKDFTHISNSDYIAELVDRVENTFKNSVDRIHIIQKIEDVTININQAVPCAMLINELIMNAYRHAFSRQDEGEILVRMAEKDRMIHIEVTDNGAGLPETFSLDQTNSLGSKLIQLLVKQLHGSITFESHQGDGTTFHVAFKKSERGGSSSGL